PEGALLPPGGVGGRAGPGRWGQLRRHPVRPRPPRPLLLRPRARLVPRRLRPLCPRPNPRELPPRPRRGLHRPRRDPADAALRQLEKRRPRPLWRTHSLPPPLAPPPGSLPLSPPALP